MINHHPDDNILTEYASGSAATAVGLIVCAHLQICPHCKYRTEQLNKLGGAILAQSRAEPMKEGSFDQLIGRIRAQNSASSKIVEPSGYKIEKEQESRSLYEGDPMLSQLPKVVKKLLPSNGKLMWKRASGSLKTAHLAVGQKDYEVALQRISSGGKVVEHDHRGVEITLVLHGSFSDEDGVYNPGDFLVRSPGEVHRPTATQNQDCLCLSVVEAPVKITGFFGKLVNPFLAFRPA